MKLFPLFFIPALLSFFLFSEGFAACKITSGITAADFLSDCGASTVWISPWSGNATAEIQGRIKLIAQAAISLWALFAVGAIVWAGIQYTKAYGNEENIKKAKTTGIYAFIGLVLLMGSFGLIDIFINFLYTVAGP
jgi:Type IV secretion system pilin